MPIHEDQREANRAGLQALNTAIMLGLTDTQINSVTEVSGTAATAYNVIISGLAVHEDQKGALLRINKAGVAMEAIGVYTDTNLAAVTTGATGARALHTAQDSTLTPTTQQGGILFGE